MTLDELRPELLALMDLPPASPAARDLRWKILDAHGVTEHTPESTFSWALTVVAELMEDAIALDWLGKGLMEPADISPELGRHPSDYETAEHILTHMLEVGQDSLRLAGRAAELVTA